MSFIAALGLLTVLPLPARWRADAAHLARSARWYPLVGAVIGVVLVGVDWLLGQVVARPARDALLVAVAIAISGGLHVDGLMDTCDGVLASVPPARRLEIMRDSHVGSFGVAGGALVLLGKYAALLSLDDAPRWAALILMSLMGRWVMTLAIRLFPAGRAEGLGRLVKDGTGGVDLLVAAMLAGSVAALAGGVAGLLLWPLVSVVAVLVARGILKRLPGLTGDVYGALSELAELLALALFPLCWRLAAA